MSDQIIKLAVGLPAYGGKVSAEHTRMFLELGHTLALSDSRFQFAGWFMIDNCGIEKARNELLRMAAEAGADWLLMIDADTWVVGTPEDDAGVLLLRMISEGQRAGATIIGAPVLRRRATGIHSQLMVYDYVETGEKPRIFHMGGSEYDVDDSKSKRLIAVEGPALPNKITPCDALATAVFALDVNKTKHLKFKFTDELSEDLYFCKAVQDEGGKIFVDGRVSTAHLSRPFPIEFKAMP